MELVEGGLMDENRLAAAPPITRAAIAAGHEPSVIRSGRRFVLACTCGWKTPPNMTRKNAYLAVSRHVLDVGRAHLSETRGSDEVNHSPIAGGRA